jgi:hypothetical protein
METKYENAAGSRKLENAILFAGVGASILKEGGTTPTTRSVGCLGDAGGGIRIGTQQAFRVNSRLFV